MSILVTNIQRMSLQDGPGVRTTVFLKGCSIHCPWCANPENLKAVIEYYYNEDKCAGKSQTCFYFPECSFCKENKENMIITKSDYNNCLSHAVGRYGQYYDTEELYYELVKDQAYWQPDGGVTFSGGEALLQIKELMSLLEKLKENKIHLVLETALFVPSNHVKIALKYFNLFYVDVKILEPDLCREVLGGDIEQFSNNVRLLAESGAQIVFRIPCSEEFTMTETNKKLLLAFFDKFPDYPIEIFNLHNLGDKKYKTLGKIPFQVKNKIDLSDFREQLVNRGHKVTIIEI